MVSTNASALVSKSAASDFPIDPRDLISGVGRVLSVIEAFNDEYGRMSVTQVAERTGIPRTAARRYLLNLLRNFRERYCSNRRWMQSFLL